MTLEIPGAKITVESTHDRYEFQTASAQIGSLNMGKTHFLSVGDLHGMKKYPTSGNGPINVIIDCGKPPETELSHGQKMGLTSVLIHAKAIERQQFLNARAIQAAALEAQKLTAEAEHKFHLSVLEALHTGTSQEDIELHLFAAGFPQLEEKVYAVHTLDTGLLYEAAE